MPSAVEKHAFQDGDLLETMWIDRYQPLFASLHRLPALEQIQLDRAPITADVIRAIAQAALALRRLFFGRPIWRTAAVRTAETDADMLEALSSLKSLRQVELSPVPDDDEPDVLPETKAYCKAQGIVFVIEPEELDNEDEKGSDMDGNESAEDDQEAEVVVDEAEVAVEGVAGSLEDDSSTTTSRSSTSDYLPPLPDDPRLAFDYKARDTVDEPDEEPWWDWCRPCDFEEADKAWMELAKDVEAGTFPFP